ncbi:MAG: kinase [Nitrososphaerota archaeon]
MKVHVKTPSRLHLGIVDLSGSLGRLYGSLGLSISVPSFEAIIELGSSDVIVEPYDAFVKEATEKSMSVLGTSNGLIVRVVEKIPRHVGLGSGTQMLLGIATGLASLLGVKISVEELASKLGRGTISGIGTAVFKQGGFVLDGGVKLDKRQTPPIITRISFPERWPIVLAIPSGVMGLSGAEEETAFKNLGRQPEWIADRVSRLVLMRLLPGILEEDVWEFGEALTEVQRLVGMYFSSVQGGVFSNELTRICVETMLENGAAGSGQSSWGPTAYGFTDSAKTADRVVSALKDVLSGRGTVLVTKASNSGAIIRRIRT